MEHVCIYNRCSTEEEEQKNALFIQAEESRELVEKHPDWILIAQYVELQSATSAKNRTEYCKMMREIENGRFTLIVIKSIDRLMRNVKDWYLFLDCITKHKVRLFMYLENRFYEPEDSLVTGIKAILAEDFSRELSKKIKNAHHRRQEKKSGYNITREMFGWNKIGPNNYERNEEEAGWYRQAFFLAEKGYGYRKIANELYDKGVRGRNGNKISAVQWRNMLLTPRAHGTMVIHKSEYDFVRKTKEYIPKEAQIEIPNALPAIVSEAYQQKVINLLQKRALQFQESKEARIAEYKGIYDLSGKIICGRCRRVYYRVKNKRKPMETLWKCSGYLSSGKNVAHGGCEAGAVYEQQIYEIIADSYSQKTEKIEEQFLSVLQNVLSKIEEIPDKSAKGQKERLQKRKERLLEKYMDGILDDEEYLQYHKKLEQEEKILGEKCRACTTKKDADMFLASVHEIIIKKKLLNHALARYMLREIKEICVNADETIRISCYDENITQDMILKRCLYGKE